MASHWNRSYIGRRCWTWVFGKYCIPNTVDHDSKVPQDDRGQGSEATPIMGLESSGTGNRLETRKRATPKRTISNLQRSRKFQRVTSRPSSSNLNFITPHRCNGLRLLGFRNPGLCSVATPNPNYTAMYLDGRLATNPFSAIGQTGNTSEMSRY